MRVGGEAGEDRPLGAVEERLAREQAEGGLGGVRARHSPRRLIEAAREVVPKSGSGWATSRVRSSPYPALCAPRQWSARGFRPDGDEHFETCSSLKPLRCNDFCPLPRNYRRRPQKKRRNASPVHERAVGVVVGARPLLNYPRECPNAPFLPPPALYRVRPRAAQGPEVGTTCRFPAFGDSKLRNDAACQPATKKCFAPRTAEVG